MLRKVYRYIVLPLYSIALRLKKRWQKLFGPAKNKYLYPLVAKPLIHIVVVVLIFSVTAVNLQARTLPNSGGEGSILFSIVGGDELELIEETADQDRPTAVTSYLGPEYGLGIRQVSTIAEAIPVSDGQMLVTTGGSALTVPPSVTGAIPSTRGPRKIRTRNETYLVQSGDTISTIAASFGLSSSTILWANDLGPRDYIRPGQELTILPQDGILHTVKSGDTLTKIANRYSVDEETIKKQNKLSGDTLAVSEELLIPGGTPPRSAPPQPRLAQTPTIGNLATVFQKPEPSREQTSASLLWPVPGRVITQYWGWRHTGLDIDGHYDTPIYASDNGVVEVSGWGRGYGIQAVINHENGFKTRYAHMSKIFVTVGQRVSRGEVIGMVGTTGFSTGTHIHYEVYVNGTRRNPLLYIR